MNYDVVVIGGGFYGARIALLFAGRGKRVLLVERERQLMGRASLLNQARVHHGYHYPRSILTSLRSQRNYVRFVREYRGCVVDSFAHYYAIARGSKVSAAQFVEFCRRIGAPIDAAREGVRRLFDKTRIEAVFAVEECAFDAAKLRGLVTAQLAKAGVRVELETTARVLGESVELRNGERREAEAGTIVNATYSGVNDVLTAAGAEEIPLTFEMTELAVVEAPAELEGAAVTVMDGAYFSLMPYPTKGAFTLSHVRYTPHFAHQSGTATRDGDTGGRRGTATRNGDAGRRHGTATRNGDTERRLEWQTHFTHMVLDAARYLPAMRATRYIDSLWETKAIMPRSDTDDSRPILLRKSERIPRLVTVLGGKIDSVYDVEEQL